MVTPTFTSGLNQAVKNGRVLAWLEAECWNRSPTREELLFTVGALASLIDGLWNPAGYYIEDGSG